MATCSILYTANNHFKLNGFRFSIKLYFSYVAVAATVVAKKEKKKMHEMRLREWANEIPHLYEQNDIIVYKRNRESEIVPYVMRLFDNHVLVLSNQAKQLLMISV